MSVPTASVGLNPNARMRIGVISEPPPMPVSPTSAPISRPVTESCQFTTVRVDQHFRDLGPRELDRRQLAGFEQLAHLRAREEDVVVALVRQVFGVAIEPQALHQKACSKNIGSIPSSCGSNSSKISWAS